MESEDHDEAGRPGRPHLPLCCEHAAPRRSKASIFLPCAANLLGRLVASLRIGVRSRSSRPLGSLAFFDRISRRHPCAPCRTRTAGAFRSGYEALARATVQPSPSSGTDAQAGPPSLESPAMRASRTLLPAVSTASIIDAVM